MSARLQEFYIAYYGRPADVQGLSYWEKELTGPLNGNQSSLVAAFGNPLQAEFNSIYGSSSANFALFLNTVYDNLFNRIADDAGARYWTGVYNTKLVAGVPAELARAQIVIEVLDGAQTADRATLLKKVEAASEFTDSLAPADQADYVSAVLASPGNHVGTDFLEQVNANSSASDIAALVAQALSDIGVGEPVPLSTSADNVNLTNIQGATKVVGIVGDTDATQTQPGTFTFMDRIAGNGLTQVELLLEDNAPLNAPYVVMTGVDRIAFVSAGNAGRVVFDASTYGGDISGIAASGNRISQIEVESLETRGAFSLASSSDFGGTIAVGDPDFDNSGQWDIEARNTLADQGDDQYTDTPISTTLYSSVGVDANLYINSGVKGGGSSVNLFANEIEVNAGAGRLAKGFGNGDEAGAHVFHYVNATEDLITADNISVALVDLNVAKAAEGEVVISNWADKTSDVGDAEALGVTVGAVGVSIAVDIAIEDQGAAKFEVRNMASNSTEGKASSANPSAHAADIIIGNVNAAGKTDSELEIKVLQLAALSATTADDVETARVGNITLGNVTAVGAKDEAGNASLEIVNKAQLVDTGVQLHSADYGVTVGSVDVGNIIITGWDQIDVAVDNVTDFSDVANTADATLGADASMGNLIIDDVTLDGAGNVTLTIRDGNENVGQGQGKVTVGTMTVGDIDVASGVDGSVFVTRQALAVDEDAAIGSTNIAVDGKVEIHSEGQSYLDMNVLASVSGTANATVGQVNIGDISVGSTQGYVSIDASAVVNLDKDAVSAVTARVVGITVGDITASASDADSIATSPRWAAGIFLDAFANAAYTSPFAAGAKGGSSVIGDVTVGDLTVISNGATASASMDAYVSVSVSAYADRADAIVGDVSLGNISVTGEDAVSTDIFVYASSSGDAAEATIGDVTILDVNVVNTDGNTRTNFGRYALANVSITATATATSTLAGATTSVGAVSLGDVVVNGGADANAGDGTFQMDVHARANSDAAFVFNGSSATVVSVANNTIAITNHGFTTGQRVVYNNGGGADIGGLVNAGEYFVVVVDANTIKLATSRANAKAAVPSVIDITGVGAAGAAHEIQYAEASSADLEQISVDSVVVTATGTGRDASVAIDVSATVSETGSASVADVDIGAITVTGKKDAIAGVSVSASVGEDGTATVAGVDLGAIVLTAQTEDALVNIDVISNVDFDGNASVADVTIGTINATAVADSVDVRVTVYADVGESGSANVSDVGVGAITAAATSDVSVSVTVSAEVGVGTAAVSDVSIADISAASSVSNGASAYVYVSATGTDPSSGTIVGSVSDVTIGNITGTSVGGTVGLGVYINANGDKAGVVAASVTDVVIGDIAGTSRQGPVGVTVTVSADADLAGATNDRGDAQVSVITIGAVSAVMDDDASLYTAGVDDLDINLNITAIGDNASVSTITIGALSIAADSEVLAGAGVNSVNARLLAAGDKGSGSISGVTFSTLSAIAGDVLDSDAMKVDLAITASALVTKDMTDESVSVSDVTVGAITVQGTQADVEIDLAAVFDQASTGSVSMSAEIDNVSIAMIGATKYQLDNVNSTVDIGVVAESKLGVGTRGVAVINDLTIAGVTLAGASTGATSDNGDLQILINVTASGERYGDITNVDIGNITLSAKDKSDVLIGIEINANTMVTGANDGDIDGLTVGNVSLSAVGSADTINANGGMLIHALDDISNVSIGDWTVAVGAQSDIVGYDLSIDAGNANSFIDIVSIDSINFAANGLNSNVDGQVNISTSRLIRDLTIGTVTMSAVGDAADATMTINVDVTDTGGDLDGLTIKDTLTGVGVVVNSTGDRNTGDDTYGYVWVDVNVDDKVIGAVEIGDIDINVSGDNASGSVTVSLSAGSLTATTSLKIGNVSLDAVGVNAYANLDAYLYASKGAGDMVVGDVSINVAGSSAFASVSLTAAEVVSTGSNMASDIRVGDISMQLSNSAAASADSGIRFFIQTDLFIPGIVDTADDIAIGDISLSSVDAGLGRRNSSGVSADVDLQSAGDILVGDIEVIGGIYADSGVELVTASAFSGDFDADVLSGNGELFQADEDLQFNLEYDQLTDSWSLKGVSFAPRAPALVDFSLTLATTSGNPLPGVWNLFADLTPGGGGGVANLVATMSVVGDSLTIDWNNVEVPGLLDASVDLNFSGKNGLLNEGDEVTLSVNKSSIDNIVYSPEALILLDNFNNLSNWFTPVAAGTITVGDIDYSAYLDDATINVSTYLGASVILGAVGNTTIIANSGANTIIGYGGDDIITGGGGADSIDGGAGDDTYILAAQTDSEVGDGAAITPTAAGIDTVTVTVGDKFDITGVNATLGNAVAVNVTYNDADPTGDEFLAALEAAQSVNAGEAWLFNVTGNATAFNGKYLVVADDATINGGDYVVKLVGVGTIGVAVGDVTIAS